MHESLRRTPRPFSTAEIDEIERLLDVGLAPTAIAAALGRSVISIRSRMANSGLSIKHPLKPITGALERQIIKLTGAGLPMAVVARLVGRSVSTVHLVKHRHGVHVPACPHTVRTSVTEVCFDALTASARRHGLEVYSVARSVLELAARGYGVLAERTVAVPKPVASVPLSDLRPQLVGHLG
jgi:hypothetical protein